MGWGELKWFKAHRSAWESQKLVKFIASCNKMRFRDTLMADNSAVKIVGEEGRLP